MVHQGPPDIGGKPSERRVRAKKMKPRNLRNKERQTSGRIRQLFLKKKEEEV